MISKISNSEIGSIHWMNYLLSKQLDIGNYLNSFNGDTPRELGHKWGNLLINITRELLDYSQRTPVNPISEEERINFLRIALSLQGIVIPNQICDEILHTIDKLSEKGGEFTLMDSAKISAEMKEKYKEEPKK